MKYLAFLIVLLIGCAAPDEMTLFVPAGSVLVAKPPGRIIARHKSGQTQSAPAITIQDPMELRFRPATKLPD